MKSYSYYFSYIVFNPVGALTSKPYAFKVRPWELKDYETFDPTAEFYAPVLASVVGNTIQRVLPVSDKNNESHHHWISNRLRFLTEGLSSGETTDVSSTPRHCLISVRKSRTFAYNYVAQLKWGFESWKISIHKSVYKLACLRSGLNIFFGFENQDKLDLFSQFEFTNLSYTIQSGPQIRKWHQGYDVFYPNLHQLIRMGRSNYLGFKYSKIFCMSFNSYFSDPVLNYELSALASMNSSIQFYTFMVSNTSLNFNSQNMLPTEFNVVSLFSGKHPWSKYIYQQTSLIIIDRLFIRTLPVRLANIVDQFCICNSNRVCIINAKLPNLLDYEMMSNFFNHVNQPFCQPVSLESAQLFSKFPIIGLSHIYAPFFSTGQDYIHTLNPVILQFSQFPKSVYLTHCLGLGFWFPVSSFMNIWANYKFPSDSVVYWSNRILTSSRKPIGQIFRFIAFRLANIRGYLHYWGVDYLLFFFVQLFVLCSQKIQGQLLEAIFLGLTAGTSYNNSRYPPSNYIVPFKWDSFGKFRFEYFSVVAGTDKYKSQNFYLKFVDLTRFSQYYYSPLDFVSVNDPFIAFSKTLSMERMFRISRFTNFDFG